MHIDDVVIGYQYCRLTVIGKPARTASGAGYSVPTRCVCGVERSVSFYSGFLGKSCGCLQKEAVSKANKIHGFSRDPLYKVWTGMKQRCNNPNNEGYRNYGSRGIRVCAEWDDYLSFRTWALVNKWDRHLDIDRVDNDGDYSPGNCRVATKSQNLRNTRWNKNLTAWGETKPLIAWAEDKRCAVQYKSLDTRIRLGWAVEDAISTPLGNWNPSRSKVSARQTMTAWGETKTLSEWWQDSRCVVARSELVQSRLKKGWSLEDALSQPSSPLSRDLRKKHGNV